MNRWGLEEREKNNIKVVDLFCGAGIGACGIKLAGFDIIWAIDNNKYAVKTYNENIGNHAVCKNIKQIEGADIPDHDIMIATPTCKSFSWAGTGLGVNHKEHGDLIYHFFRLLKDKMPKAFLFENVDGMLGKKHIEVFLSFVKDIESIGYNVKWIKLDCYDYGVPQHRKRVFIVGIRTDIKKEFNFPNEIKQEEKTTIRDAIADLPDPDIVINSANDIQFINHEKCDLKNHIGYGIRKDEMPYINKIPIGGDWRDLDEEDAKKFMGKAFNSGGGKTGFLRKISFDKPAYTITSTMIGKNNAQIIDNQDKYYEGGFSPRYLSRNRQKQWDEPSFTIVSEVRHLALYPEPSNYDIRIEDININKPPRRFTVRECLRLQTVPDWFKFDDSIPLRKQYERCSGIPSLMAYKIMIEIEKVLI